MRGRWVAMSLFVLVISLLFVRLGLWQLDRRAERAQENQVYATRLASEPEPLLAVLGSVGSDVESLEFRRVGVTGTFRPDLEVLVRNRTNRLGTAGFHVLTPFELSDGSIVIINRGWVPLDADQVPLSGFPPPSGMVDMIGLVRLTEVRSLGPVDPEGDIHIFSRVDLDRLSRLYDSSLAPVWLQTLDTGERVLPEPLEPLAVDDPGPHLSYAVQWFSFAAISVVGYAVVLRQAGRKRSGAVGR